ncbi:MAG: hypothetical protein WBB45_04515 [Cyclobacteriaceae bacterium]
MFINYNVCRDPEFVNPVRKQKKNIVHLSLRPRIHNSLLAIDDNATFNEQSAYADFGNKVSYSAGMLVEFVLPFNQNKWSVILEPTLQNYKKTVEADGETITANYTPLELPIGLRYYFFLNDDQQAFINAAYAFSPAMGSALAFSDRSDLELNARASFVFGAGYKYRKLSGEVRYSPTSDVMRNYVFWSSEFSTVSFVLGIELF